MIIPYELDLDLSSRCARRRRYAQQVDRWLLLEQARQHRTQVARPRRLRRLAGPSRCSTCTAA